MQDVYVWSRKIHRFTLFFTIALGLFMMTTGLMMKFSVALPFLDLADARGYHNIVSVFFAVVLFIQMLSGFYMYIHPWILRWWNSRTR